MKSSQVNLVALLTASESYALEHGISNNSSILSQTTTRSTSESSQTSTISPSHKKTISIVTKLHSDPKSDKFHDAKHDIRLEDIFWSGADAEPLIFSMKSNAHLSTVGNFAGKETFVKTATVVATVYVDGNSDEDKDAACNSNKCEDSNEISDDYSPSDKRYWLITVVFGTLTDEDISTIEEKLAKLYRVAFTRQQSYHLGLSNGSTEIDTTSFASNQSSNSTINHKRSVNTSIEIRPTTILEYEKYFSQNTERDQSGVSEPLHDVNGSYSHSLSKRDALTQQSSLIKPTPTALTSSLTNGTTANQPLMPSYEDKQNLGNSPKSVTDNKRISSNNRMKHDEMIRHVSVMIHNISIVTEDDRDYLDSQVEAIIQNTKNSTTNRTKANLNETEIIYTVFVNGQPVLAKVAADDMKLLTNSEVAKVLEKIIQIKAEPYLKDLQSTPLIPAATMSSDRGSTVLAMLSENAYIFIACAIAIFVTVLILMCLMVVLGSAEKKQKRENKKSISREAQTYHQGPPPPTPDIDIDFPKKFPTKYTTSEHVETSKDQDQVDRGRNVNTLYDSQQFRGKTSQPTQYTPPESYSHTAYDNYAYEHDRNTFIMIPSQSKRKPTKKSGSPIIYFPKSPATPVTASTATYSSTSSISDASSIYYIKRHKKDRKADVHVLGKNLIKFDGRQYATIKKRDKDHKQKVYKKSKRKYLAALAGNRVSAFEDTVQVHSPPSNFQAVDNRHASRKKVYKHRNQSDDPNERSDDTFETSDGKNSHFYEHIEAFNPVIIRNRQKSRDSNGKVQAKGEGTNYRKNTKIGLDDQNRPIKHESRQKRPPSNRSENNKKYKSSDIETIILKKSHKLSSPENTKTIAVDTISERLEQSDFSHRDCIDLDSSQKISPKTEFSQKDDLSIGSFLSMESVRKFPKCEVPDALTKVLEPVSITYFDHFNETEAIAAATAAARKPRIVDTKVKTSNGPIMSSKTFDGHFTRSRSDATDPGVIGPAVWKLHKKQLEKQDTSSPLRDPVYKKNRYEDLVEGAIKLYSIETTERHDIETIITQEDADCMPGIIMPKEPRGKSAAISKEQVIFPRSSSMAAHRPFTAGTTRIETTIAELPLSPSKRAWASGAQSLSEHQLSSENVDVPISITITAKSTVITSTSSAVTDSSNDLPTTSAVPLIDSIQREMKKFHASDSK